MSSCDGCKMTTKKLFLVNESSWAQFLKNGNLQALQRKRNLCGHCLRGISIPVFRPSKKKWQVGEVISFDWEKEAHCMSFGDDQESIAVTTSPFSDYVSNQSSKGGNQNKDTHEKSKHDSPGLKKEANPASDSIVSPIRYQAEAGDSLTFRQGEFIFEKGQKDVRGRP